MRASQLARAEPTGFFLHVPPRHFFFATMADSLMLDELMDCIEPDSPMAMYADVMPDVEEVESYIQAQEAARRRATDLSRLSRHGWVREVDARKATHRRMRFVYKNSALGLETTSLKNALFTIRRNARAERRV